MRCNDIEKLPYIDMGLPGGIVADPELNDYEGIKLYGHRSMYIFDNVIDMDMKSFHPSIFLATNSDTTSLIGKLFIEGMTYTDANDEQKYLDPSADLHEDLIDGNLIDFANRWLDLPNITDMIKSIKMELKNS